MLDDPALRKAARCPDLVIVGVTVADNLEAARAALQPPAKPGKDK